MLKFGRNYLLSIGLLTPGVSGLTGNTLNIEPPFTIEFDITRNILSSTNVASIRIYNLSANNRNQLRFNLTDMQLGSFMPIKLQAGYGASSSPIVGVSNLPVIFNGNITQAWSVREWVNFITVLECFDGGFAFANGLTAQTIQANTELSTILVTLAQSLPNITLGAIGSFSGQVSRGQALMGNTCDILREWAGQGFFIDNGKAYILNENEYVDDAVPIVVNATSGLLGTPIREVTFLDFDIIFEPNISPGRLIQLQSSTDPTFNGFKKVVQVKHRGMISPAVCGEVITSVRTNYTSDPIPVAPL